MKPPRATYRLQFRNGMDFDRAARLVPYLQRLGVSHLYASPIFTAVTGSTHGYDVTDHTEIDPALGGREGFERLSTALRQAGLGVILDIVPNHMAASLENPWWRDVVEWGQLSPFHKHFDIDWRERLTLPVLGKPFDEALASGEFKLGLDRENGRLVLSYFDTHLPLTPPTYQTILSQCDGPPAAAWPRYASNAHPGETAGANDELKALLSDLDALTQFEDSLSRLSGDTAFLDALLAAQPWRLVFWKEARKHLSYRRFFEVTGLVGVRVEDSGVFDDVHRLIVDLVRSGHVDGLRVDHVDGLADPKAYLDRLRQEAGPHTFIIVEKILARDEALPRDWPIEGTTGYEFISTVADIFVDGGKMAELGKAYAAQGGCVDLEAERHKAKRQMVTENFETELADLSELAADAASTIDQDLSKADIKASVVELIVAFPVYRTYGNANGLPDNDRALLDAIADKIRARSGLNAGALAQVLDLLCADVPPSAASPAAEFRTRFQQLTGPVMAKAVEDTLFYRCNTLIALNEVGCDPSELGSVDAAHARLAGGNGGASPLLGTATHDTKRGEDARARLYAISEAPVVWAEAVERWRGMHEASVKRLADGLAPEPQTEWLLYQALAGIWPASADPLDAASLKTLSQRFQAYVEKALRESKLRTDWTEANEPYERAVKAYAADLLAAGNPRFLDDFSATLPPFIHAGAINSLSQTLIKLTAPGIPDIYQGSEGSDFSLVDPDNRQLPDFAALERQLAPTQPLAAGSLHDGSAKQQLIAKCLAFRAAHEALFDGGSYMPLLVSGERSANVFAFLRHLGGEQAIVIVPRLVLDLVEAGLPWGDASFWADTRIHLPGSAQAYDNILTAARMPGGEALLIAQVLHGFPVALLAGAETAASSR